jgi:hypothetical protein
VLLKREVRIAILKDFAEKNQNKRRLNAELWHRFLDTGVVTETLNRYKEASKGEAEKLKILLKEKKFEEFAIQGIS